MAVIKFLFFSYSSGHWLLRPSDCVVRSGKVLGCSAMRALQSLLSLFWMFLTGPGWWSRAVSLQCIFTVLHVPNCNHAYFLLSLLLNLCSKGRQGTSVVSGNRMVPAGVSHVCPQCLLSHAVRAHLVLSVEPLLTPGQFNKDKAVTHLDWILMGTFVMLQVWLKFILVQNYFRILQRYRVKTIAAPMWSNRSQTSQIFNSTRFQWFFMNHILFACFKQVLSQTLEAPAVAFALFAPPGWVWQLAELEFTLVTHFSEHMQRKWSLSGNSRCPDLHVCSRFRPTSVF